MKFAVLTTAALVVLATPVLAEDWHAYSRTGTRAYLADVDSIATVEGGFVAIRAASVPLAVAADDLTHGEEIYQFDCAGRKWRTAGATDFAADGSQDGDYPEEGAAWEPLRPDTVPDFLKQIACDGSRSAGTTYPSIRAFAEAGRP
ncbi:surface-adhesin E family protein [Brevundimonas sp. FT23042]|uniref:surface-adhesin E family protein n=1 Tax=Brevundimonas sp. FT23042 TaxID=3393749 RepID=UPI003B5883E7